MRGLAKGSQCTATNPILQLIARSAGYLADITEGTYKIEDIHDSATAAVTVVSEASFNLTTHKVGTGRYWIPTGSTAVWNEGTHRITCTYKMEVGGPTYTQIIDFEILDTVDWPDPQSYVGYISTRDMYRDGYAASTVTREQLHRLINEASRRIEDWTGRWFEPRYVKLIKKGQNHPDLQLKSPIIAIEDIYAVWETTTGEDTYKFEQYLYKVYNRHLDGWLEEDDRHHPFVRLTDVDGDVVKVSDFAWPYGNQNIHVYGVFGYTDPQFDENGGQVLIGTTPREIGRVAGILTARYVADPTFSSPTTWSIGSLKSYRTRDQSITFGGAAAGSAGGGSGAGISEPSGDPNIDRILIKYCQPWGFVAI